MPEPDQIDYLNAVFDRDTRSVLDVCYIPRAPAPPDFGGWWITRINVPAQHRRQGIGTRLLTEACAQADAHNVSLYLTVQPYGDFEFEPMLAWYMKHGFEQVPNEPRGFLVRHPR